MGLMFPAAIVGYQLRNSCKSVLAPDRKSIDAGDGGGFDGPA